MAGRGCLYGTFHPSRTRGGMRGFIQRSRFRSRPGKCKIELPLLLETTNPVKRGCQRAPSLCSKSSPHCRVTVTSRPLSSSIWRTKPRIRWRSALETHRSLKYPLTRRIPESPNGLASPGWPYAKQASWSRPLSAAPAAPPGPFPATWAQELPSVSVVIPVYNELHNVAILVERVGDVLARAGWPHEILLVDDGSTDGTTALLRCLAAEKPEVRAVLLQRNFGQTAAMAAGFDYAAGELVVTLDGDLQNDPDDIPRLLRCLVFGTGQDGTPAGLAVGPARLQLPGSVTAEAGQMAGNDEVSVTVTSQWGMEREGGGFDLVCGWRRERKDSFLVRNLPSALANALIGWFTGVRLHDYGCSLKAYRGHLARSLRIYGELHRFLPALAAMEGASICEVPVKHHPRRAGASKYGLLRIPRVLLDLSVVLFLKRFRDRPLQFFGLVAAFPLLVSAAFLVAFASSLLRTGPAYGWAMALSVAIPHLVACLEFLVASVLLLCMGLVADLCMRTYYESQDRPVYRVRDEAAGYPA